jgi:heme exporter protein D
MPPFALFSIESSGLNLAIDLLLLFVAVLYFALIYWTYTDAKRRIEDPILVWCATAAAVFPFVGAIIYMVLRPPEYLEDVRERELETQAAEARVRESQQRQCPHCEHPIETDFVRCPSCMRKLKERCSGCSRPLDRTWKICPYCETEVPAPTSARRAARRRAASGAESRAASGADSRAAEVAPLAASEAARNPRPVRTSRPSRPPAPES